MTVSATSETRPVRWRSVPPDVSTWADRKRLARQPTTPAPPRPVGPETGLPRQRSVFTDRPWGPPDPAARAVNVVRLQGFELRRNPCIQSPGVTPTIGADPLLGFHLPRVFALPAMTTPIAQSPLTHLVGTDTEAATSTVPQSLNEQEVWLASLEAADPSEVCVLISLSPERPSLSHAFDLL